ncbi:MAG: hypothetical protein JST89_24285 [Cyanobacteria bacterium SZAS-4]|nr:hypothetical protein [Cyanobacteria bacterium SZAS-4]
MNRQILRLDEGGDATFTAALRGGKGASLALMLNKFKLPVPPGFTILPSVHLTFMQNRGKANPLPPNFSQQLHRAILGLEKTTGKQFGSVESPLIVSVRSGAAVSMPGMMDTILNVGLNDAIVEEMTKQYGERFAYDSYRRLLEMFGESVFGIERAMFTDALRDTAAAATSLAGETSAVADLKDLCRVYKAIIAQRGREFPQDPYNQLAYAIYAVFNSWDSPRAQAYRRSKNITALGTAVTVQTMVFGNRDERSATGVVFSRDRNTGARVLSGDFVGQAQGEDVVAGSHRPLPIAAMRDWNPSVFARLEEAVYLLEDYCRDVVDVEFTVDSGELYFLQWRPAKKSVHAAIAFAIGGVFEGRWNKRDAVNMVSPEQVAQLFRKQFEASVLAQYEPILRGISASLGASGGFAVFTEQGAKQCAAEGLPYVLFRVDTSTRDLPIMLDAQAIVTANGGEASHAAIVARDLNIPAVVGCLELQIEGARALLANGILLEEGHYVSVDGETGKVYLGQFELIEATLSEEAKVYLNWQQRLETKVQAPRLHHDRAAKQININTELNNFYILDWMLKASKGDSSFNREVSRARNKLHIALAETVVCYLALAVAGELRHVTPHNTNFDARQKAAWKQLRQRYAIAETETGRFAAQSQVLKALQHLPHEQHIEFFELAVTVFERNWSATMVGGPAWAAIAKAGADFLTGRLSHTIFVDHVFDLEHNGGALFDKRVMMVKSEDNRLKLQLYEKRNAKSIKALYRCLNKLHPFVSVEVQRFWTTGMEKGLW